MPPPRRFVEARCSSCGWKGLLRLRGIDRCPRCQAGLSPDEMRPAEMGASAPMSLRVVGMMVLTGLIAFGGLLGSIALLMGVGLLAGMAAVVVAIAAIAGSLALYRKVTGWSWQAAWLRGEHAHDAQLWMHDQS